MSCFLQVMNEIQQNGIRIYTGEVDDDDDDSTEIRDLRVSGYSDLVLAICDGCPCTQESVPFSIVGSNTLLEVNGKRVRGRLYPWGVVEVENKDHCDFVKLRNMLIRSVVGRRRSGMQSI